MYGKFFASTYTGSMIASGADVFAVWGYVVAHAVDSTVELNPRLLAAVIGSTPERMREAIDKLCMPDIESRSKEEEGRRLIREGEFQYRVVNHQKYRDIRNEDTRREYNRIKKQESRERQKAHVKQSDIGVNAQVNRCQHPSAHTEADTETEEEEETSAGTPSGTNTLVVQNKPEESVAKAPRATRKAPKTFLINHDLQQWAREKVPGLDIRAETEKFRDHTFARSISDWAGAWRNWMRKAYGSSSTSAQQSLMPGRTPPQRTSKQAALEQRNAGIAAQFIAKMAGEKNVQ